MSSSLDCVRDLFIRILFTELRPSLVSPASYSVFSYVGILAKPFEMALKFQGCHVSTRFKLQFSWKLSEFFAFLAIFSFNVLQFFCVDFTPSPSILHDSSFNPTCLPNRADSLSYQKHNLFSTFFSRQPSSRYFY